jgi:Thrombospondin type 3 repeat
MGRSALLIVLALALVGAGAAAPQALPVAAAHPEPGDIDGDGVRDEFDNCPQARNADQSDVDRDGLGDKCDPDADADGDPNAADNCPLVANPGQEDDGPEGNPNNGLGDACDRDSDGDTHADPLDNCPAVANANQADFDGDDTGDACDVDNDDDGVFDAVDNCRFTYNFDQADADRDGRGSACDDSELGFRPGDERGPSGDDPRANDRRPPRVRLSVARAQRLAELGTGVAVKVRCSEACALEAELTVDRSAARRLGLGRRARTVAAGTAALAGRGTTYVFLRFKRGATARLARMATVPARLSLTAADDFGNDRTSRKRVQIRR